jgi:branched-chain amino acid transport system permease protein
MMITTLLQSSAKSPRWARFAGLLVLLVVVLGLPWFVYPPVALDIMAWALFAMALDLLLGYTGLLSFGHAAFWGGSAYATGYIATRTGLPFYVAILGGAMVAVLLALPVGYLSVRRTGIYFAMVTLAFAQLVYLVANQWRSVTGGENGLQAIPRNLFGLDLSDSFYFYYAALPLILAGFFCAWRIVHSPFGRVLVSIRENPARARALGYSVDRYKLLVFVLSAFLAGIAGGVFAVGHGFASLQEVYWTTSGKVVIMTVLGGMGTLWGPALGAGIIVRLEDFLSTANIDANELITGMIFIVTVLVFRKGIWGTIRDLVRRRTAAAPEDPADEDPPSQHDGRTPEAPASPSGTQTR